jgi:hypothetical protein
MLSRSFSYCNRCNQLFIVIPIKRPNYLIFLNTLWQNDSLIMISSFVFPTFLSYYTCSVNAMCIGMNKVLDKSVRWLIVEKGVRWKCSLEHTPRRRTVSPQKVARDSAHLHPALVVHVQSLSRNLPSSLVIDREAFVSQKNADRRRSKSKPRTKFSESTAGCLVT